MIAEDLRNLAALADVCALRLLPLPVCMLLIVISDKADGTVQKYTYVTAAVGLLVTQVL